MAAIDAVKVPDVRAFEPLLELRVSLRVRKGKEAPHFCSRPVRDVAGMGDYCLWREPALMDQVACNDTERLWLRLLRWDRLE